MSADLSQLTAIISTSDRPQAVQRLVKSVRRGYPGLKVLVADASSEPLKLAKDVDKLKLPTGSSRSLVQNMLLSRVRTPYFLLLDDRCELSRETELEQLVALLAENKLDIAAGGLVGCRRRFWFFVSRKPFHGHGLIELAGDELKLTSGYRTRGEGFWWCDLVHNFYAARTDKVRALGGWDQQLENDEREEFFVRAHRKGLRVGLVPEVTASIWSEVKKSGSEPARDLKSLAVAKMGLSRMTDLEGRVTKAPRRAAA